MYTQCKTKTSLLFIDVQFHDEKRGVTERNVTDHNSFLDRSIQRKKVSTVLFTGLVLLLHDGGIILFRSVVLT